MPMEIDPSELPSRQLSLPDDPFDDLYRQYESTAKPPYQRLGTDARYTPAAKPTSPPKEQVTNDALVEALIQLVEGVWALTRALLMEAQSEDGDNEDAVQA